MIGRRIQPLLAVCFLGGLIVIGRLYQVQIDEHGIWSRDAALLLHSGRILPAQRGAIEDTRGRVLARDRESYGLSLVYREFRRGHPLRRIGRRLPGRRRGS